MLAVIQTHPVQYQAPVYRVLQTEFGIPVTAIYGSDFSVAGYHDEEFNQTFAWDTDLMSGYQPLFLSRVAEGGARAFEEVSARGLERALRQVAPRATLVCGYSPRFHQLALYHAWRARRPILFRAETTDQAKPRRLAKSWLRDRALRTIYSGCSRLLYVGQRSYEHYKRLGCPDTKLVFSPYCVDTSPFQSDEASRARLRAASRAAMGIAANQTVALFSGKLSSRKGADLLIAAVQQLTAEQREDWVVVFVGNGEDRNLLVELARRPPSIQVVFAGFHNQTQLSSFYHAADLLVLPSRHRETWGLVVNEALHHGLPAVVSQAVGCAPDLIRPAVTGEIFETGSVDGLARALGRARELVGRAEVRELCRAAVADYTVHAAAIGIAAAYRAAVAEA
jgi:glycosyltransferase involved in cell wall biosynthesis